MKWNTPSLNYLDLFADTADAYLADLSNTLRSNAWNVEICRDDYSEHDVANVLKRFVRQLEEPLLTDVLRHSFSTASRIKDQVKLVHF